jgi:hypothetical protein
MLGRPSVNRRAAFDFRPNLVARQPESPVPGFSRPRQRYALAHLKTIGAVVNRSIRSNNNQQNPYV